MRRFFLRKRRDIEEVVGGCVVLHGSLKLRMMKWFFERGRGRGILGVAQHGSLRLKKTMWFFDRGRGRILLGVAQDGSLRLKMMIWFFDGGRRRNLGVARHGSLRLRMMTWFFDGGSEGILVVVGMRVKRRLGYGIARVVGGNTTTMMRRSIFTHHDLDALLPAK